MVTITTLIINEMKHILGHEPTLPEMNSLSEFLATRKIYWLVDLELAIVDWEKAFTKECAWCGNKFLQKTMIHTSGNESFCCDQCKQDYKKEHGVAECTE